MIFINNRVYEITVMMLVIIRFSTSTWHWSIWTSTVFLHFSAWWCFHWPHFLFGFEIEFFYMSICFMFNNLKLILTHKFWHTSSIYHIIYRIWSERYSPVRPLGYATFSPRRRILWKDRKPSTVVVSNLDVIVYGLYFGSISVVVNRLR